MRIMDIAWRWYDWFFASDWTPDAVTAAATVVLTILTMTLAGGTLGLWFATRKLVRESQRSSQQQLRAYLCVETFNDERSDPIIKPDSEIILFLRAVNRGQTPAYKVRHVTCAGLLKWPTDNSQFASPIPVDNDLIIGPGGDVILTAHFERGLTPNEKVSILSQQERIYAFGTVHYEDAFNKHWITNFRLSIATDNDLKPITVEVCEGGNDAT